MKKEQLKLEQVQEIDLKLLRESPLNPRMDFGNGELEKSIRAQGVLVPLVVRYLDDIDKVDEKKANFDIIDGARRFRAAKKAGLKEVPCIVRKMDDKDVPAMMFDANIHRNLKPAELGSSFVAMRDLGLMTIKDIAKKAEISEAEVSMMIKLTLLPKAIQVLINEGFVSRDIYRELINFIGFDMMKWAEAKLVELRASEDKDFMRDKDEIVVEPLTRAAWYSALSEKLRKTQEDSMIVDHLGGGHFGPQWMKEFDDKDCKKCKRPVSLQGNEVCLDNECWKPKAREAKRAVQAQKVLEKADPKAVMKTSKMSRDSYNEFDEANFDVSACAGCPDKKKGKDWNDKLVPICTYPTCFEEMDSAAEDAVLGMVKQLNLEIEDEKKVFLDGYKPVGLDPSISVLILQRASAKIRKDAKPAALEKDMVKALIGQMREFRSAPDDDDIKHMKEVPFLKDLNMEIKKPKLVPSKRPPEEKKELAPGVDKPKKKAENVEDIDDDKADRPDVPPAWKKGKAKKKAGRPKKKVSLDPGNDDPN